MKKTKLNYFLRIIRPYLFKKFIGLFTMVVSVFLSLITPYLIKQIIDVSITNKNLDDLFKNVILFFAVFTIGKLFKILQNYIFTIIGQKILYDLRMNLYTSISNKNLSFFNTKQTGELMSRVMDETPVISNFFSYTIVEIISQIITIILTLVIMFSLNFVVTVFSLCIIPLIYCILHHYNPKIKEENDKYMQEKSDANHVFYENFTNIKLIKYSRKYKFAKKRASNNLHILIKRNIKLIKLNITSTTILSFIYIMPSIILLLYGGYQVILGYMSVGSIVALNVYISRLFNPIQRLTQINVNFQKTKAALKRYYNFIKNNDKNNIKKIKLNQLNKGITLQNINYSYSKNKIFDNLNFTFSIGDVVVVKGSNGTGKSTLIDLISGVLKPDKGVIKYDDINIENISTISLKKSVGVVPQNIYLFNDTIRNNICLGKKVSDKKIKKISKKIGFEDVVSGIKINLDKYLTDNGNNLSGGQKQKIVLLRVLINDYNVLLLDEPDKFLDNKSKELFYEYIFNNLNNKIVILISHQTISTKITYKTLEISSKAHKVS
jgi:ABC-type bacteriocin/lantibiotic exporter with double-glycine peptidase domain